jgi:hypothetical protein
MKKYTVTKHEIIDRVYEVEADSEEEAVEKVDSYSSDIVELAGNQGYYECEHTCQLVK